MTELYSATNYQEINLSKEKYPATPGHTVHSTLNLLINELSLLPFNSNIGVCLLLAQSGHFGVEFRQSRVTARYGTSARITPA